MARTGIEQIINEGKLHFIHRNFAEFYVADYFVKELKILSNIFQKIQDLVLQKKLLKEGYLVIRFFMDGMLSLFLPSNDLINFAEIGYMT